MRCERAVDTLERGTVDWRSDSMDSRVKSVWVSIVKDSSRFG